MKRKIVLWCMIHVLLFTVFFTGQPVYGDSRSDEILQYAIQVRINPDGSGDIEERLTYRYKGKFNGTYRDVDFSETGGLINPEVFVEKNGNITESLLNSNRDLDSDAGSGSYNLVTEGNLARFKIYETSENEDKTYIIKYTFKDVVTKYNDIAEFNRKIVDSTWALPLKNISIDITLPQGAEKEEIKVYGHGSLTGLSKIIDASHVQFITDYAKPGSMVETRVLFPIRLVPQAANIVQKDALAKILADEKAMAEEANRERAEAKKQVEEYEKRQQALAEQRAREEARIRAIRPYGNAIAILFFLLWFVVVAYLYRKYDKELKPHFEGKYYRELPGEYTPAEMSVLLSMGRVETRDITATLMDLVRKEQLLLKEERYMKKGLFKDKEISNYIVSMNPNAPTVNLKNHESFLIDWFIGTIGNGQSVILDEISGYTKTTSRAERFQKDYTKWCSLAVAEADKNNFFDSGSKKGRVTGILISFLYLGLAALILFVFRSAFGVALALQFLILLIFSARIHRRTAYGSEQRAMWLAFKNFLKDFSHMNKAEMPSIIIWEHYLVYAISLGVAKEVIRQLPLVFGDVDTRDAGLLYMYGMNLSNFNAFSDVFDQTVHSVDYAISNAMSVANSTLSSASGEGGGFSGGSSGGGGGGGGGGSF